MDNLREEVEKFLWQIRNTMLGQKARAYQPSRLEWIYVGLAEIKFPDLLWIVLEITNRYEPTGVPGCFYRDPKFDPLQEG